jgi:hypothetical protein
MTVDTAAEGLAAVCMVRGLQGIRWVRGRCSGSGGMGALGRCSDAAMMQ